jgi:hypothetical protein
MRAAPEQSLQKTVASYLDLALPADAVWTAINPVPAKSKAAAGLSKAMGMKAGWPDLLIIWNGQCHAIELKAGNGRLSTAQIGIAANFDEAGAFWERCKSLDEVAATLKTWGIPLRARAA